MNYSRFLLACTLLALAGLPFVLSQSLVNAAIQMLIAVLFASAFNVLAGQGGMLSFGHAAYFGVGAFATVHAMNAVGGAGLLPTPLLPLIGGIAGCVLGSVAGWFSTKRIGVYFSMITLALAELLHSLAPHLAGVFGGEAGVSSMRMPAWGLTFGTSTQVYYLTLFWVVGSLAVLFFFTRTPVGRLTLGLRENGHRIQFLGYNVHALRVLVFMVSATFAGVAGGLQAMNNEAANYVLFDARLSSEVVLNAYIGGVGVFLGPALGAAVMTFFGYAVSDLTRTWLLYQGILFVIVMMYMPGGMSGLIAWWAARRRTHALPVLLPPLLISVTAGLLLTAGTVFTVEMLQRIFHQDYQSLIAQGSTWPPIALFGAEWLPGSVVTWLLPVVAFAAGAVMLRDAAHKWQFLADKEGV